MIPRFSDMYQKPSALFAKATLATLLGFTLSGMADGKVNFLLICMVLKDDYCYHRISNHRRIPCKYFTI